ncbi:MAG: efflux RND transporter periplasmic adaptor subunit [Bacteroidota bacterium]
MKRISIIIYIPILSLIFSSCVQTEQADHMPEKMGAIHAASISEGEEVALTKLQMEKIGVEIGSFTKREIGSGIKVNGVTMTPPKDIGVVNSLIAGRIQKIRVKPDQYVKRGTVLATLESTELIDWQEAYLSLGGQLEYLEKDLERKEELVGQEVIGSKELERLESEIKVTKIKREALSRKLKLLGLNLDNKQGAIVSSVGIRSPISGYVDQILVQTGLFVQPHEDLFSVINNAHLHLELKIFEKDLSTVKAGQSVVFALSDNPSEQGEAHIMSMGHTIDGEEKTVTAHAHIEDQSSTLLPGMYVEAYIQSEKRVVDALPESAIAMDKGLEYIFIKEEEHAEEVHFLKVPISSQEKELGFVKVDVLKEIPSDASIVTKGAFYLMAQMKSREEEGGHHH